MTDARRKTSRHGRWLAGLLGAGLLAGGCAVGPDYKAPQATVGEGWGELGPSGAVDGPATRPSAQPLPVRWWTTFNDPTLNDLIARAARSNLDLRRATARIRESRASREVTQADIFPNVDVGGSYNRSRNRFAPGGGDDAHDQYKAGFDASWEVDVFGGVRRGVEAANADIAAAVEDRRDVLVSLLAEVARNYIELRGSQRRITIAQENLAAQQKTLDLTKNLLAAGVATDLDVARAEAQVSTTESQIPLLQSSARQSIHALGVLLGTDPMALTPELSQPLPIPNAPPEVPVGIPSQILLRRPDLRRAEAQLHAATARIGVATADLFPRFSLTGSLGLQSSKLSSLGDWDSRYWSIGPSVAWPIFDAGRIAANINVQNARQEQALLLYQQTVLDALRDVEDSLVAYAKEETRRRTLTKAADANRRAVDLANQLYDAGRTDFLSVLQAQRDLFASQDAMVQSDIAVATNLVALYKALGGGWEVPPENPQ
ncbi:MAG: efflux transporter outer membrane subunit [Phycisphaerales bacterium]|nr:efflux transporter outer membrane subunit [Phycisphaerales bacterium]